MKHLILDTETTDLVHNTLRPSAKQPRIIEFYGELIDDEKDWGTVKVVHHYINPGIPIPEEVTKITRITNDQVKNQDTFIGYSGEIKTLIENSDVVVAHNLSYDRQVIDFEYGRLNESVSWPVHQVCTVEATEHLKGFRLNLNALHVELFGASFEGAHSAEVDAGALKRCYVELKKRGEI